MYDISFFNCVTNYPTTEQLKTTVNMCYASHFLWGRTLERISGLFDLGSFVKLRSRCQVGLQICESLGQRICLHESLRRLESSCWSLAGRPQFSLYMDLSSRLLECPHNMTADSPRAINTREREAESSMYV